MTPKTKALRSKIGAKVRQLRRERRWTQARLAELLGLSQNYLSVLERGQGSFTAEQLLTILKHFNVPIDYFSPEKTAVENQIQNALARQGAVHLAESELIPSERLKKAADAIREALVSAESARQITAIAPILVSHADQLNLDRLHNEFAELGLEFRLGWAVENTLEAIKREEESAGLPPLWRRKYRRARLIIDAYTKSWREHPGEPGKPPPFTPLDPEITSEETFEEIKKSAPLISKKWRIVSRLGVEDFARALRAARGAD